MSDDIQTLKEQEKEEEESPLKENGHNPLVTPPAAPVAQRKKTKSGSLFGPLVLIVLGALFLGRNLENANPVPPPDLWIRAAFFRESKIPSMLSSTGNTKHAANCPNSRPAFINVGELGKKRSSVIMS